MKCMDLFSDLPEALLNNFLPYLFKCNFKATNSKPLLPEIISDKQNTRRNFRNSSNRWIRAKFKNKFIKINDHRTKKELFQEYKNRLDHEIKLLIK